MRFKRVAFGGPNSTVFISSRADEIAFWEVKTPIAKELRP